MYQQNSLNELIENNHMYQHLGQKLDIPQSLYNKTIGQVCVELNLNTDLIQTLLKAYDENIEFPYEELNSFSIGEILNYLKLTHRFYLYKKLPEIEQTILELFNNYSDTHHLLVQMCHYFVEFKNKLVEHIKFEEKILFPYIQKLISFSVETSDEEIISLIESFSTKTFIEKHTDIEEDLVLVRKTIVSYSETKKTPLPYNIFLSQIKHFEIDLNKHAMIEDQILIKKVNEIELNYQKNGNKKLNYSN